MSLGIKNIILTTLIFTMCACFGKKTEVSSNSCNSETCINSLCPGYAASSYSDENSTDVCSFQGSCEIPNMPLTFQMNLQMPGNSIACGPAAAQMITNSILSKPENQVSGWLSSYSSISESLDPTGASSGYCENNKDCRQVLSIGTELINTSWAVNPKRVNAAEMASFFEQRAEEMLNAKEYDSNVFPSEIDQCTFVSGDQALTNGHPWTYSILYLEYPVNTSVSSRYNETELIELTLKEQINGHYIALKGYEASSTGLNFKFHDPIYGIKYYSMVNIKEDEPVCIVRSADSICSLYLKIKELPTGFKSAGTFLVASPGEEKTSSYTFKFIASISGMTP